MKKKQLLLTMMLLLASVTGVYAQVDAGAIVSITNVRNLIQGYSGSFDIVLNNTNTTTFIAFGLDVQLPEGFTYTGYERGDLLVESHTITQSDQGNNTYRFSAVSLSNDNFTGTEGVVLKIKFDVASAATSGTAYVKNAGFTYSGETYRATDASELLNVNNTLYLDENEEYTPEAFDNVNAYVNRTFQANRWSTIVLPFAMTADQVTATFGDGVKIGYFKGINYESDTDDNITSVTVNFEEREAMDAHTPYIIKVPTAMPEGFTVNNVNVTEFAGNFDGENQIADASGNAIYDGPAVVYGEMKQNKKKWYYDVMTSNDMIGTYKPIDELDANCLFLLDNVFRISTGKSKLKAFRAYFYNYDVDSEYFASRSFIINFNDGSESTGVSAQKIAAPIDGFYNLTGQQVKNPAKGIYITRGKKVIIK